MQGASRGQLGILKFFGLGNVEGCIIWSEALADRIEVDGESCCRGVSQEVSRPFPEVNPRGTELGSKRQTEPKLGQQNNDRTETYLGSIGSIPRGGI